MEVRIRILEVENILGFFIFVNLHVSVGFGVNEVARGHCGNWHSGVMAGVWEKLRKDGVSFMSSADLITQNGSKPKSEFGAFGSGMKLVQDAGLKTKEKNKGEVSGCGCLYVSGAEG